MEPSATQISSLVGTTYPARMELAEFHFAGFYSYGAPTAFLSRIPTGFRVDQPRVGGARLTGEEGLRWAD